MQLTKKPSISEALAAATCSLLSTTAAIAADNTDINIDASYLDYREHDRVKVREVDLGLSWNMDADNVISGKLITDSMTGATPSGALTPPTAKQQTATTPSGVQGATGTGATLSNYLQPLEQFTDRRVSISTNWEHAFSRILKGTVGGVYSNEDDYQSYGANIGASYDLNQKLTTLEAGIAGSYDTVDPANGPPSGDYYESVDYYQKHPGEFGKGHKLTLDESIGVTQVLSRTAVLKASLVTGSIHGYLADPYKVLNVLTAKGEPDSRYFHEIRPTSHARHAINLDFVKQLENEHVINVSYRHYWDSWDIKSETLDFRYRVDLKDTQFIQHHVRFYKQSAAYFFTPSLTRDQDPETGTAPRYASADYRLDKLTNLTIGLTYGLSGRLGDLRARYERMDQIGSQGDFKHLRAQIWQFIWILNLK